MFQKKVLTILRKRTKTCEICINKRFNKILTTYIWMFGGLHPASTDLQCLLMLVLELAGDWVIMLHVVWGAVPS